MSKTLQQPLNWAPSFHSYSTPGYSPHSKQSETLKMQIETLQCLPSFVTLRAKSLPRPTKPAGTLLRTQAGASTFQGPVFTSPQLHHQLPPLTCHQMRRLQVTEVCTTGVYSSLIEHALVLQRPRISCPEVCKPASRAAIYSSI